MGRRNGGRTVVIPAVSGEGEGVKAISQRLLVLLAVVVEGSSVVVETDVVSVVMVVEVGS